MIIAIVGAAGSGKDTAAEYLVEKYKFEQTSFADSLKNAVAEIFSWDVELLQGKTKYSREWREQVDEWWSKRLNIPQLTPRWILQQWGTEVGRNSFHYDIWVASLERKLLNTSNNVVISDCRFPNELIALRSAGATTLKVTRGPTPAWHAQALKYLEQNIIPENFEIHYSEWAWLNQPVDLTIKNDGTLAEFKIEIDKFVQSMLKQG